MDQINAVEYYRSRGFDISIKKNVKCPFHDDKEPSMSINILGLWFCHAGCSGGNLLQFEAKLRGISTKEAYANICKEFNINQEKYIKQEIHEEYHKNLLLNQKALDWLSTSRGIRFDIVKRFLIGLELESKRITIPIMQNGFCVNIRKYKPQATENKVINTSGFGGKHLFPYDNINEDIIYIMEGEMDCLLANQLKLNAVTSTGSAHWDESWNDYFNDKDVIVVYDIDPAGRKGADTIIEQLKKHAKSIKNILLPIKDPPNGDFTDYIITHGFNIEDFKELVGNTKDITVPLDPEDTPTSVNLADSSNSIYYGKYLETGVTIAGKDFAPYNIPSKFTIKCNGRGGRNCGTCPLQVTKEMTFLVDKKSETVLDFISINKFQKTGVLRKIAGVNCEKNFVEVINMQSIEEIITIPEMSYGNEQADIEYVTRTFYYSGHGLKTNKAYLLRGYSYTNPKDQHSTMVVTKAISTQGSLDPTQITKEIKESLKIFECKPELIEIDKKLKDIYDDFSHNVTHIFGRDDLLLSIDLAYHSALHFDFLNTYVHKGWVDALVLGDTRNGKSKSIEGLSKHYRAGEIVVADKITFAGLVGGGQKVGNHITVTWGKWVLNDAKLIAIDEMSSMELEMIGFLSSIRSKGEAEVNIQNGAKTNARTRFICFSNPRNGKKMSMYSKGVTAIKELIGKVEDISRFDFAVTVADGEINQKNIDNQLKETSEHKYLSDYCHNLVMWAWTRKRDDIIFMPDVEDVILKLSNQLTERFDSTIPLVTPAEQRIKLARLSIALAIRLHSTDTEGNKVIVYSAHVEYIYDFLMQCYTKPSMAYDVYSDAYRSSWRHIEKNRQQIITEFTAFNNWPLLKDILLNYEMIKKSELELLMDYSDKDAKNFFGWVGMNRLMHSTHNGYAKHPMFIQVLKSLAVTQMEEEKSIEKAKDIFGEKEE